MTSGLPDAGIPAIGLRRMRWWDIEAVQRIEEDLFADDPWSLEMFWSELAAVPASRYYVVADVGASGAAGAAGAAEPAESAGADIAGYAGLMTQPGAVAGEFEGWVQNIAVARARQGRGFGGTLLTALIEEALRRSCSALWLEVRTDNVLAQSLYRHFGFESAGLRRGYYQPGNHDALIMRLDLANAVSSTVSSAVSSTLSEPSSSILSETPGKEPRQ